MISPQQKSIEAHAYVAALQWYADSGVDLALWDEPQDRRKQTQVVKPALPHSSLVAAGNGVTNAASGSKNMPHGASEAKKNALSLARDAQSLDELREAIVNFEGLSIKRTATTMVFHDGKAGAPVMIIGEAPGTDEDRQGKAFVGQSGQLLDLMTRAIGLDRNSDAIEDSVYLTNILNWRPPGNRTPSASETDISLPFIEKHILLAKPKVIVLCGSLAAKTLLGRSESISRLRGQWHDYRPISSDLGYDGPAIPALATYHPAYLLRTPAQKRAAWKDMLELTHKLKTL